MSLTLHDIKPIGLCISTLELFDTKRFLLNYCDGLVLRGDDVRLKNKITNMRRELNSIRGQPKFLEGYKAILVSNIDKIIALVDSRYAKTFSEDVGLVKKSGNGLIDKILGANNFEEIMILENSFKSNVVLPTHRLFIDDLKRSRIQIV
jgi:hypothetical protein